MNEQELARNRIVDVARSWLGTPYHHGARVKGVGVDCGTLVAEVFTEAGVIPPVNISEYPHDFHLHRGEELYLGYVRKHCWEVLDRDTIGVGDIIIWKIGRCFSHGGIYIGQGMMIHSALNVGVTLEEIKTNQYADREQKVFSVFAGAL